MGTFLLDTEGVIDCVVNGRTRADFINVLVKQFGDGNNPGAARSRAVTLTRTEVMHTLNTGAIETYASEGVHFLERDAEPDACAECLELASHNGGIYPINEYPGAIAHPRCRCVPIPVEDDDPRVAGRLGKGDGTAKYRGKIPGEKGIDISGESGIIEMYRRKGTHRKTTSDGKQIIDKATYHRIVNPAIKSGADIRIADDEWKSHLKKNNAFAVTIGDVIYFNEDATVSDVLEEVHHFYQNKSGMNSQYGNRQREIMNEIDAKEYLLKMADKYHIPEEETSLTQSQLESYRKEMNTMKERGEWDD